MKKIKKSIKTHLIAKSKYHSVIEVRHTLLKHAKRRALKKGLEFNIDLEDVVIPRRCPILKKTLVCSTRYSPSIDRINPLKGYIKGNVAVISTLANAMKANATPEEIKIFAKNIKKYMENHLYEEVEVEELPYVPSQEEINDILNAD